MEKGYTGLTSGAAVSLFLAWMQGTLPGEHNMDMHTEKFKELTGEPLDSPAGVLFRAFVGGYLAGQAEFAKALGLEP